jgi:hypothetical protein
MPNTTRISIATTVSTGRLMAVSEMNISVIQNAEFRMQIRQELTNSILHSAF